MQDEVLQIGTRALAALFFAAVDVGVERGRMDSDAEITSLKIRTQELEAEVFTVTIERDTERAYNADVLASRDSVIERLKADMYKISNQLISRDKT